MHSTSLHANFNMVHDVDTNICCSVFNVQSLTLNSQTQLSSQATVSLAAAELISVDAAVKAVLSDLIAFTL